MEVPEEQLSERTRSWFKEIDDVMRVAVANAIEENRRLGLYPERQEDDSSPAARVAEEETSD